MQKYRSIYIAHQLDRAKIIFYYRTIINNVVLSHIFVNHFAKMSHLLQKLLVALHYTLRFSRFLLFCISSHTALVTHLLRAHSNFHQYSGNKYHELILALFILSHCLLACVIHSIIYKKDIFDKAINSLCVQNIHYDALCIVHERIYTRLIYHLLL